MFNLLLQFANKTFNPIAVNSPEFNSLEVGDEKVFCSHKSIFGVSFLDIKNDDNQKCKYKNDMLPMKKEKRTVGLLLYGVFPLLFLAFALINTFNHRYIFQFSGIELPYGCRRKVEEARFRGNKENDITITSLKAMSISKNYIIRKNNLKRTKKTLPEIIGNNYFKYGMDRTLQHIDFPKCWYCVISDPSSKTVLIYELEKNKIWIIDDSMDLVDYSAEEEIDADDETEVDKETEAEECIEKFLEIHFKEWEISWFHVEPMTVYDSNRIAQEYGDLKAMEIVTNNKKYYYEEDSLYEAEEGWVWTLTKKDYQEWKVRKVLDSNGNDLYRDKEQK